MVELMLTKYKFDKCHVAVQATLVLYSQGLTTGVVVDIGDGVCHMVPVYDGVTPSHLVKRVDLAGRDVTRQLIKLLQLSGYQFNKTSDFEQVRMMKEQVCYVAPVYGREVRLARETTHVNCDYQVQSINVLH
jgi:actin-related protein 2